MRKSAHKALLILQVMLTLQVMLIMLTLQVMLTQQGMLIQQGFVSTVMAAFPLVAAKVSALTE